MGEITDALRRAREEAKGPVEADAPDPRVEEPAVPPAPVAPIREVTPRHRARRATDIHIPHSKEGQWVGRAVIADDHGPFSSYYRHFALRLRSELMARDAHVVVVTSAVGQDGKTTTACNLALATATVSGEGRVAIVELDMRRPTIARTLSFPRVESGIEHALQGAAPLTSVCLHSDDGIDIYPVARPNEYAHEILARAELGSVLQSLASSYDCVIIDTPPVLAVPDVSLILPHADACITVARAGVTPLSAFRAMLDLLPRDKVIGAFLNQAAKRRDYQPYEYESFSDEEGKARE